MKVISGSAVAVEFCSKLDSSYWTLLNVYGPCTPDGKTEFTSWIKNLEISEDDCWIIMGDFNLYNMISYMGWSEIPLQGQKYT